MSWQDDLRQLDQALADGRISADGYREGRDKILAAYATGATPSGGPPSGPLPAQPEPQPPLPPQPQTQQPQQNPGPFAPPFRWTSTSPSEATQVVTNQPPGNAETTQVVPGGRADNPEATQVVNRESGASERTQAFRPVGGAPGQPWSQQQPQQQPQWSGQDSAPPWGSDTGLVAPHLGWVTQGPEVFEQTGTSKRTWLIISLVIVVVLAGLGVGAFFLFGNHHGTPIAKPGGGGPTTTTTAPTTTPPPRDDLSIATLPGHIEDHSDIKNFADATAAGFLTQAETGFYQTAGANQARLSTSVTDSTVHVLVFTTQVSSVSAATTCRDSLAQQEITYGMQQYPNPPVGVDVAEVARTANNPAIIRAHYVHNHTVVRIQVNGDDLATVTAVFRTAIAAQLKVLSANG